MTSKDQTQSISPELFTHLVKLAALELTPQESEYLRHQLNNQLKAIHELEAIPLDPGTVVTTHGVPYTLQISPPVRLDEWQPYTGAGKILAQAPETEDGYIVVPEIEHTDLK